MAKRVLRPLGYGDLLDEVFDLYKSHFLLFFGIVGIATIPILLMFFVTSSVAFGVIAALAMIPISMLSMMAASWAVSRIYLGHTATILKSYRAVIVRVPAMLWTMVLAVLLLFAAGSLVSTPFTLIAGAINSPSLIIVGGLLSFAASVIVCMWIFLASITVVLERLSGLAALNRGRQLVAGNRLRTLIVMLIAYILMYAVMLTVSLPLTQLIHGIVPDHLPGVQMSLVGLVTGAVMAVVSPFPMILIVLLYYDIRVRKEGFDIEMLAADLQEGAAPTEDEKRQAGGHGSTDLQAE